MASLDFAREPGAGATLIDALDRIADVDLVRYFAQRENVTYPFLPKATEGQLRCASDCLEYRFTYTGETFQFAPGFSWKPNPSSDKEWQIAFHKHYFLIDLAQAWRVTGDPRYLNAWIDLLSSWMNEMGSGHITVSDAQVEAKRMESWVMAFMLLDGTPWDSHVSGDFLRRFFARMADETAYICDHLKPVRNHRTFQLYAIFLVAVIFPELRQGARFLALSSEKLAENLLTDFQADGVHIEMSSHYHQLVAETAMSMLELATLNRLPFPDALRERLHRALRFSLYMQWPNGDIPLINDSDNGNHLNLLRLGAQYLNDPMLLWGASLGREGQAPKAASIAFEESGYFILGDSWGQDVDTYAGRQHVFCDFGKLGEGSHSHYDLFNFCYYLGGAPAIVDPGRYTYAGEPDADGMLWRHYFKGTAAHNTVTIDRKDQTLYLNRTKHGPEVELEERDFLLGDVGDFISGLALSPHYSPSHHRTLLYMGHQYLFVRDRLDPRDDELHHYALNVHLPAEAAVERADAGAQACSYATSQCQLAFCLLDDANVALRSGWVSRYYGIKEPAPILTHEYEGRGRFAFATVVAPRASSDFTLSRVSILDLGSGGSGYKVVFMLKGCEFEDLYLFAEHESALICVEDVRFRGKFLVVRRDGCGRPTCALGSAVRDLEIGGQALPFTLARNLEWRAS